MSQLAIESIDTFLPGHAPHPVVAGQGLSIGTGIVLPEIKFTLPPVDIEEDTWPSIRKQYDEMIQGICRRAVELSAPGLLVEVETLPPMTLRPVWAREIVEILAGTMREYHDRHGLRMALRLTPNDLREFERPPRMRGGRYWENMVEVFRTAAAAGADLISIESTGGKEIHDDALTYADLRRVVFALGVLGARDMDFLWREIVDACRSTGIVPAGDSACGFANTAMVMAERNMIPRVFAAVVRVATVPRSLVAYEVGAMGPSKDCAYEGPYMKAIAGVPISMEGRTAACAHLSPVGNISQAVCDAWSNESVQNIRLLSAFAPVVSVEQLTYDCRLMNTAGAEGPNGLRRLRDWLSASDAALDPQAYVLHPEVVLRLSREIMQAPDAYGRTVRAVRATVAELRSAAASKTLSLAPRELSWLDRIAKEADDLPDSEEAMIKMIMEESGHPVFLPAEYGIEEIVSNVASAAVS